MQEERTDESSHPPPNASRSGGEDTQVLLRHAELDRQIAEAQLEVAEIQRLASEQQREVAAKLREALREICKPSEK